MDKKEATRNFIIEKTAPIFNKKGYAGTYLSDLTAATGLTKGSIYGNFKDKNEVSIAAFRYNLSSLVDKAQMAMNKEDRADLKLIALLAMYKSNYQNIFSNGGCAMLNTATDADDNNPALLQEVSRALISWKDTMVGILLEGIKAGELKPHDTERFSCQIIALIEGSILMAKTLNNPQYLIYNIEFLEDQIKHLTK